MQQRVATEFDRFQERDTNFHAIDAARSSEAVHADICQQAAEVLRRRDAGELPLRELWGDENAAVLTSR